MKIHKISSDSPSEALAIENSKRIRLSIANLNLNKLKVIQKEMYNILNQSDVSQPFIELEKMGELHKLVKMAKSEAQELMKYLTFLDVRFNEAIQSRTQESLNPMI